MDLGMFFSGLRLHVEALDALTFMDNSPYSRVSLQIPDKQNEATHNGKTHKLLLG